jgi:hypothetical protein
MSGLFGRSREAGREEERRYWRAEREGDGWALHNSARPMLMGTPFEPVGALVGFLFPRRLRNQAEKCPGPAIEGEGIRVKGKGGVFYIAVPEGTSLTATEQDGDLLVGRGKRLLFRLRPSGEVEAV